MLFTRSLNCPSCCCCSLAQAIVEHRDYYDTELAERQGRLVHLDLDPSAVPLVEGGMDAGAAGDIFGEEGEEEGYQEDGEEAEQGGLGYQ